MEQKTSIIRLVETVFSNDITLGFSAVIVLVFMLGMVSHVGSTSDKGVLSRTAPTILTSIGVLGTFMGIFLGLLDFDVSRIDKSVPTLLSGLKVAFVTSILGMFFAIVFKIFQSLYPKVELSADIGAAEIHKVLTEIRDGEGFALEQIRKAISDESDSSMVTQIQKLRTTIGDGQKETNDALQHGFGELGEQFATFAETMAENNTKALVDALESVIRDFNTQLNEQFGDNFKQLNEAVAALLTWQEQYKEQLREMGMQFNRSLSGIETAEASLNRIAEKTGSIPEAMESLSTVINKIDVQIDDLEGHLEAVAHLKEQASTAFPFIEEKLELMTNGIESSVARFMEAMEESLDTQEQAVGDLKEGFSGLKDQTDAAVTQLSGAMDTAIRDLSSEIHTVLDQQSQALQGVVGQMHEGFRRAIEESNDVLGKQIEELDQQMQNEVRRVVELMGGHLASLSKKFVDDYTPLTDRLRDVIKIAEAA